MQQELIYGLPSFKDLLRYLINFGSTVAFSLHSLCQFIEILNRQKSHDLTDHFSDSTLQCVYFNFRLSVVGCFVCIFNEKSTNDSTSVKTILNYSFLRI